MSTLFNTRVLLKRDTEENWNSNNPVLLKGELVFVDTSNGIKIKVGDGSSTYSQLEFMSSGAEISAITNEEIDEICGAAIIGGSEVQL